MSTSFNDPDLIAEHDTWISFDPVLGCPADCAYCYLGELGLRATKPRVRASLDNIAGAVEEYLNGRRSELIAPSTDTTPLCIGNYTDMMMTPANRNLLIQIIEKLVPVLSLRPVVLITKARLDQRTVAALEQTGARILWFFSQSFAAEKQGRLERGPTADVNTTIENAELVSETKNQRPIHFWRPFVRELVPPPGGWEQTLGRFQNAGMLSSVVIGMKRGPVATASIDPRLLEEIPSAVEEEPVKGEVIDQAAWEKIRDIAKSLGYPIYRHTSCAIALAEKSFEKLGTWRLVNSFEPCGSAFCLLAQEKRCAVRRDRRVSQDETEAFVRALAKFLSLEETRFKIGPDNRSISIDALVTEFDFNVILHASAGRYSVFAKAIARQKAWQGTFAQPDPSSGA